MKHVWSILCEKSSIDNETNILSIFSCVEEISLTLDKQKMPADAKVIIPANFQMVSFWSREDGQKEDDLKIKIELLGPAGELLNQFNNNFKLNSGVLRFRNRINISGLPISGDGRYYLKIWQENGEDSKLVAELPLDVKISYKLLDNK